jgi:hypothetical protein
MISDRLQQPLFIESNPKTSAHGPARRPGHNPGRKLQTTCCGHGSSMPYRCDILVTSMRRTNAR